MNNLQTRELLKTQPQPLTDGRGNDTGCKIGIGVFQVPEPIDQSGAVNVKFADRTYGRKNDLAILEAQIKNQFDVILQSVENTVNGNLGTLESLSSLVTSLQVQMTEYQQYVDNIINVELVDIKARLTALEP